MQQAVPVIVVGTLYQVAHLRVRVRAVVDGAARVAPAHPDAGGVAAALVGARRDVAGLGHSRGRVERVDGEEALHRLPPVEPLVVADVRDQIGAHRGERGWRRRGRRSRRRGVAAAAMQTMTMQSKQLRGSRKWSSNCPLQWLR